MEDDGEEGDEGEDEDVEDESEASGAESGDDSNDEEVDIELRNKIEEALRVNGIEAATGDSDEEEEELMDDEQMMAIDEQLAEVFRSRVNEKKSGKGKHIPIFWEAIYLSLSRRRCTTRGHPFQESRA